MREVFGGALRLVEIAQAYPAGEPFGVGEGFAARQSAVGDELVRETIIAGAHGAWEVDAPLSEDFRTRRHGRFARIDPRRHLHSVDRLIGAAAILGPIEQQAGIVLTRSRYRVDCRLEAAPRACLNGDARL